MIISASYKTDIPTFYGAWFLNRLRAGYCKMVNPYNYKVSRVELTREAVDGFVFWTKNAGPFLPVLDEVAARGYPFVVQYAINGYPRSLEQAVVDTGRAVVHMHTIHNRFGPRVAVWRYDTIVCTSLTPFAFHRRNFAGLAAALEGATDEVVVSFAQIYRKTQRNMDRAAEDAGFSWGDPPVEDKQALAVELAEVARRHGMQFSPCAQPEFVTEGAAEARCVDVGRLSDVAGRPIIATQRGNRPTCGCFWSRDIGEYDTCPHGCVYCYAVQHPRLAHARYQAHDPHGEFLFPPPATLAQANEKTLKSAQPDLFG